MNSPGTQSQLPSASQAQDDLFVLADVATRFARVARAPRYPDGQRETDVEHSFHLALSATELAAQYYPELDVGLVAQFSIIHDLPEVSTGDVWTFDISDEDRAKKELAEKHATEQLLQTLPPHTADLLRRYEKQVEPEARFVRFVDKILPAIINSVAGEANTFKQDHGVTNLAQLITIREATTKRLQALFPEYPFLYEIWARITQAVDEQMFPDK